MVFEGEQIMKLAFYLDTNGGTPQNTEIYNFLNESLDSLEDAAIFFENTNFNPVQVKFGMFDAADLWSYSGNLICTSPNSYIKAKNVVNRQNISYLFDSSQKREENILNLISISKQDVKVFVNNEVDQKTFKRITGVDPINLEGFNLDKLKEVCDE